ncbi:hypothetical protein [Luteibacter jiangsuensis]|jgi:hypothetical protein
MRTTGAIFFAVSTLCAAVATAQTGEGLPKATLEDAGQAAGFAQFLCNTPGGEIDSFRRKVDTLTQGGTSSADYHAGEAKARAVIDQVRHTDNGDTRELEASTCPEAVGLVRRIIAQP